MIIESHPETSLYTLNNNSTYPYYASKLKLYHPNDPQLFPNHELPKPGPILTPDGMQEHKIKHILNGSPVDAVIGTLSNGLATALRTTNGYQEKCSRTVRRSIDGLKLVEMGQLLDSSFPGV